MLFQVCLLVAAQIAGGSTPAHTPHAANAKAPVTERRARSLPQAQARMVAKFNQLVAAMRDFSLVYNGTHVVNARKAEAVRRAWQEFDAAEAACRNGNEH